MIELVRSIPVHLAISIDVANVCGHTWCTTDIVEAKGSDERVAFEEKREWLSDSSASTENGDLGLAGS